METFTHIGVPIVATIIMGLVGFAVHQMLNRVVDKIIGVQTELSEHKKECDKINKEVLDSRLVSVEQEVRGLRKFSHWIGNSIMVIAAKMGIDIPDRPI